MDKFINSQIKLPITFFSLLLRDATIDLNLPADHPEHLEEGESILLNVNAFRPLENVHIKLGTARMDNLPTKTSTKAYSDKGYCNSNVLKFFHIYHKPKLTSSYFLKKRELRENYFLPCFATKRPLHKQECFIISSEIDE